MKIKTLFFVLFSTLFATSAMAQLPPNTFPMDKNKAIQFRNSDQLLDSTEIVRQGGNSLKFRYKNNNLVFHALDNRLFQIRNAADAVNIQFNPNGGKSFLLGKLAVGADDAAIPAGFSFFVNGDVKATEVNAAFALENAQKIRFKNALGAFDGTEITRTSNDALRFKTVGGTSLLLDVNGNVGVNHLNPTGRLHIAGDPNTNNASLTGTGGYLVLGNTNGPNLALDNNEIMARSNGAITTLGLQADGGALLIHGDATTESEKVLINSAGLVGIGNANPQAYLHITQAPDKPYAIKLEREEGVHTNYELFIGSSQGLNIKNSETGNIDMVFGGDTTIGINTVFPTSLLHLKQRNQTGLRFERDAHNMYELALKGSKGLYFTNITDLRHEMVFDGNGKIGIGTDAPSGVLHVMGDPNINDAGLSSTGGFLVLGNTTGPNLAIDNNEIMARNNGTITDLNLQADGGSITVHGGSAIPESEKVHITGSGVVGIGTTTVAPSAALDIQSTNKGMLVPRLTTPQRTAISSPATGLLVYDSDQQSFYFYTGTSWTPFISGSNDDGDADDQNETITAAVLNGNSLDITEAGVTTSINLSSLATVEADPQVGGNTLNYLSKWDGSALVQSSSVFEDDGGNVGIGTGTPAAKLHIAGVDNDGINSGLRVSAGAQTMLLDGNEIDALSYGLNLNANTTENVLLANGGGNVGIGTGTPAAKLHIAGVDNDGINSGLRISAGAQTMLLDGNEIDALSYGLNLNANTTENVLLANGGGNVGIGTGTPAAKLHIAGVDNDGINSGLRISAGAQTMLLDGNEIDALSYGLNLNANTSENVLLANGGGNVGIGTNTIPGGYKLAVNGSMVATELKVKLQANWPDYVFEKDYPLLPLKELEKSIQQNGHLPGIPSAREVRANDGVEVGDMQVRLLEKVEELTLYIIQLEKRIHELEAKK